jgi:hypothetical protein
MHERFRGVWFSAFYLGFISPDTKEQVSPLRALAGRATFSKPRRPRGRDLYA